MKMTTITTKNELNIDFARAVVARLSDNEMNEYVATPDQYLFADELCTRHDFHNSPANVDVFEIALDDRAIEEFDF
jgi:hypothetical protein